MRPSRCDNGRWEYPRAWLLSPSRRWKLVPKIDVAESLIGRAIRQALHLSIIVDGAKCDILFEITQRLPELMDTLE